MKFIKPVAILFAVLGLAVGLSACDTEPITGPSGAPLVIVASSENPTTDLLPTSGSNAYRRSITVTGSASNSDLFDTFDKANTLATNEGAAGQLVGVVFSQAWYDALTVPSGSTRAAQAGITIQNYLPATGSAARICNAVFIDSSIETVGRTAMFNAVQNAGQYQSGAKYQYRTYSADPGNELLDYANRCYSEGADHAA